MSAAAGIKVGSRRNLARTAALLGLLLAARPLYTPATAATRDALSTPVLDAALPPAFHPLAQSALARYQTIFDLQRQGRWADADREIGRLTNKLLVGHVLLQRYAPATGANGAKPTYRDLADWMTKYRDHPGADQIYKLALAQKPKAEKGPGPCTEARKAAGLPAIE